jgi:hypothetical protein
LRRLSISTTFLLVVKSTGEEFTGGFGGVEGFSGGCGICS